MLGKVEKVENVLKHHQISQAISRLIREGVLAPGSRLPGEMELARQFGVSHLTVRQAKRTLIEQGVLYSINRKGVYVAREALASRAGVFTRTNLSVMEDAHFFRTVFQSLEESCRGRIAFRYYHGSFGVEMTRDLAFQLVEQAKADHIEVALLAQEMPLVEEICHELGIPIMSLGIESYRSPRVSFDSAQRVHLGLDYFFGKGIREIGLIGREGNAMAEVFRTLYTSRYPEIPVQWLGPEGPHQPESGVSFEECGYRQFHDLWSCPQHPKGVFVLDDIMLKGSAYAMMELGVRPGRDFELVGCYNKNSHLFVPVPFVHIESDPADFARAVATMVTSMIQDPKARPSDIVIDSKLVNEKG
ncbi:MAG: GntR family transcriptional regulator [Phycisphaerae bacterium]|nr:GntR family transcriptional regulator [Phycisphaerae bacterium]